MAIVRDGIESYRGAVLKETSHFWADGMEDVHVYVWDAESQCIKSVQVGYFGSDGCNLMGCQWDIDATPETYRAVRRYLKREAWSAFAKSVTEYKRGIRKGTTAQVVRGRKVKTGTVLKVFWTGERPTYRGRQCPWLHETETIAGCYDEDGNKVWIKVEYLKSIDVIKSPNARERKKFIKAWVEREARNYNA